MVGLSNDIINGNYDFFIKNKSIFKRDYCNIINEVLTIKKVTIMKKYNEAVMMQKMSLHELEVINGGNSTTLGNLVGKLDGELVDTVVK